MSAYFKDLIKYQPFWTHVVFGVFSSVVYDTVFPPKDSSQNYALKISNYQSYIISGTAGWATNKVLKAFLFEDLLSNLLSLATSSYIAIKYSNIFDKYTEEITKNFLKGKEDPRGLRRTSGSNEVGD